MVDATALNRGKVEGQAISGGGGTFTVDVPAARKATLTVQVDMTGAVAGDLTVAAQPYELDASTLLGLNLPVVGSTGPTAIGGTRVAFYAQYDVSGVDKVRLLITNNNAGAQTITRLSWILTGEDD